MRSRLFDDVVRSFAHLQASWGESGTDQCFFTAVYGLPLSFHLAAMQGALVRALPGVERRWPAEVAPRQLASDLRGWFERHGRSIPCFLTEEDVAHGDAEFADAASAALNGVKYAGDAGALAVSTTYCVGTAIHALGLSVWEQNDPEAAGATPDDWRAGKFEHERWYTEDPGVAEVARAEWTRALDELLAAGAAEVPLPDAKGIAARERALERWIARSGIFIQPERAEERR